LFNLRHSSARNVIERIFGVFKRRFRILHLPPEYDMSIQARIPSALAALHNFIRDFDPEEVHIFDEQPLDFALEIADHNGTSELKQGPVTPAQTARANERRDRIANDMWVQYQEYL